MHFALTTTYFAADQETPPSNFGTCPHTHVLLHSQVTLAT
jgi:hypothetical protein